MADGYLCPECSKVVTATKNNRYRTHKTGTDGDTCTMSSVEIPGHLLEQAPSDTKTAGVPEAGKDFSKCPHCTRKVKLTRLGYFEPHDMTLRGGDRCPNSGVRFRPLKPTADLPLPGDDLPEKGVYAAGHPKVTAQMEVEQEQWQARRAGPPLAITASAGSTRPAEAVATASEAASPEVGAEWPSAPDAASGASTGTSSPESVTTSTPSPPTSRYLQPPPYVEPSRYLQPPEYQPEKAEPMEGAAVEIATRFKEIFYSHSNRRTKDNRSAQTTLGPSEIGTPCDRRLAMALMDIPPVNPGGDGWAAWVGTQGHAGLEEMFKWASANTGRFSTEVRLNFPSKFVPHGTSDLFDRVYGEVWDFKFMGAYSLKKFKLEGPSDTYRIQGHVYGLGQELAGEKVKKVVILGLPRAGSSLNEMHVWEQKFDRKVALAALARVDAIAAEVGRMSGQVAYDGTGPASAMEAAQAFPTADDCRYCPFFLKNDKEMTHGCPGS